MDPDDPEFQLGFDVDLDALVSSLRSLRKAAIERPLTVGTSIVLTLTRAVPHPRGRPLPRFASRLSETGRAYTIVLEKAFQTGCDALAQVWLARVVDPESPGEFLGQIVAKII